MGLTHLLDTDICIHIIRQRAPRVLAKFKCFNPGSVGISIISVSELQFGAEKSSDPLRNRTALDQFLLPLAVLDYDLPAARHYGEIRHQLESKGIPIGPMDMLIAAHARSLDVALVTHNISEFNRVPGLKVETW